MGSARDTLVDGMSHPTEKEIKPKLVKACTESWVSKHFQRRSTVYMRTQITI